MKCPRCGLISPGEAMRCDCGFDFPSGEMKRSYSKVPTTAAREVELEEMSVVEIVVYTIITYGIFIPFWLLHQRRFLGKLEGENVNQGLLVTAAFLYSLGVIIGLGAEFSSNPARIEEIKPLVSLLNIVSWIIILVQCFRMKAIFERNYAEDLSGVATFFLTIFYLQYRMNRIVSRNAQMRRSAR